jgi:hypothetical protein
MKVGIGTVTGQFLFWEYLFRIFGTACFFAVQAGGSALLQIFLNYHARRLMGWETGLTGLA